MAVAVALLPVVLVVLVGSLTAREPAPSSASTAPAAADRNAVAVARAFLDAYGEGDADRAIGSLSYDAQISLLIRSVGADGVEGTTEELRLYLSLLDAWRYRQEVTSCTATGRSEDGTDVRCAFDYDFLGSDVLGLGPYTGSSFDLTIRGDEVVSVSKFWAFDRFAREVWDPFGDWIAAVRPNDARHMYDDPDRRGVRLDEGSIRRWRRHTADYLRTQLEQSLIGDLLRAPTTTVLGSPLPRWVGPLPP
jgi:hypothetical protein